MLTPAERQVVACRSVSICTFVPVKQVNCSIENVERRRSRLALCGSKYSKYCVYLLYWYQSTNTDT
jgi:hypothetical protein